MKDYAHMLNSRTCQKCKRLKSPVGGKLYRGKLLRCADCRKPLPLDVLRLHAAL